MFKICALALALMAPTVKAQDFLWNITEDTTNFVDVVFSDARGGDEIKLNYFADDQNILIEVRDHLNCNISSDIATGPIQTTASHVKGSRGAGALVVPLDIDQTQIAASSFYTASGPNNEIGTVELCVRIDLTADLDNNATTGINGAEESINFHETKLKIVINMTEGFTVTDVITNRTEATETDKNASLDYTVIAFETNDNGDELQSGAVQYTQGDFLQIGVKTNSTSGVKVANIISMILSGDDTYTSIDPTDASESSLTDRNCAFTFADTTPGCKVKTMLVSGFFINANPAPVTVNGIAVMEFVRARRLSSFRGLQQDEESTNEQFDITVDLQPMNFEDTDATPQDDIALTDSAAPAFTYVGMAAFVVAAVFSFFLM